MSDPRGMCACRKERYIVLGARLTLMPQKRKFKTAKALRRKGKGEL